MIDSTAVVTGGNQGLGLALVRGLCAAHPGRTVYLGARDEARGKAAVEGLRAEGLSPELLIIDVSEDESVQTAAELIRARHGGVDLVISNAAARLLADRTEAQSVRTFVDTNNHGAVRMIRAFGPLLREHARFLVVASAFGSLRYLPEPLHAMFDTEHLSLDELGGVMDDYVRLVETGQARAAGWPESINIASKIGQVAAVRIMAREYAEQARAQDVLINAACPGLVDTDASRPWFSDMSQAQSPDEAARDVLWLASLPVGTTEPYGELVQYRAILPWTGAPLTVTNRTDG
ncbi:SDR family NAD(P)-dependent oxidoreductase [Nocardia mexicana]|nr:SDR family NAD(P)-dependent oxidoreductase [Nocardia mexicana]